MSTLGIKAIREMPAWQANPKPIVINEDSPAVPNLDAAWRNGCSWGYYDQGFEGQADDPWLPYQPRPRWNKGPFEELNGFQTVPVNWTINSGFKKAFFSRVAEVTMAVNQRLHPRLSRDLVFVADHDHFGLCCGGQLEAFKEKLPISGNPLRVRLPQPILFIDEIGIPSTCQWHGLLSST